MPQNLAGAGEQFVGGNGDQHAHFLGSEIGQRYPDAIPLPPGFLEPLRLAGWNAQAGQAFQAGHAQFVEGGQANFIVVLDHLPIQVRVGDHRATAIDQRQLGAGGLAQAAHLAADVVHRSIHADHRAAVDTAPRHGQADLAGGVEHVGQGQDGTVVVAGIAVPLALTRVETVVGLVVGAEQAQVLVVVTPLAMGAAEVIDGDALHQVAGLLRRFQSLSQLFVAQAAHQQELAVRVTDIDGAQGRVGAQVLHQHGQPFQTVRQALAAGNRIVGQQAQGPFGRIDQAPDAFVDGGAELAGGFTGGRHQDPLDAAVALDQQSTREDQHAEDDGPGDQGVLDHGLALFILPESPDHGAY
ncbi:hypothetical protein D3C80_1195120 [compost metagenome]